MHWKRVLLPHDAQTGPYARVRTVGALSRSRLVDSDSSQASRSFLVREMPRLYDFCMAAIETNA